MSSHHNLCCVHIVANSENVIEITKQLTIIFKFVPKIQIAVTLLFLYTGFLPVSLTIFRTFSKHKSPNFRHKLTAKSLFNQVKTRKPRIREYPHFTTCMLNQGYGTRSVSQCGLGPVENQIFKL